jgi:hypothetical protein
VLKDIFMLTFAETGIQLITSLIAFTIGLAISISQNKLLGVPRALAVSIYIWHTAICIFYLNYSLENNSDSTFYYLMSINYYDGLQFGTKGVLFLTSIFSNTFGMSYGGTFLVFNILGTVGILAFAGALFEITQKQTPSTRQWAITLLFLPGMSFWTAAIGKDSLAFMATGLMIWASLRLKMRYPAMLFAFAILFLVRPHMGGIAVIALALALTLALKTSFASKAVILISTVPAAIGAIVVGLRYIGLEGASSISDITEYIEDRQGYNLDGGSSIDIAAMPWPIKMFSYLVRPLPTESPGILGLLVGIENIIILIFTIYFSFKALKNKSTLDLFPRVFMILFSASALVILANTTANLGIAIRQKWMFFPMIMCVLLSYAHINRPRHYYKQQEHQLIKYN